MPSSKTYDNYQVSALTTPATVNGKTLDADGRNTIVLYVDATVVVATGTLDVKLQDSPDGSRWFDISGASITQITAAGKAVIRAKNFGRFVRAVAVVGTANVTFQLDAALGDFE